MPGAAPLVDGRPAGAARQHAGGHAAPRDQQLTRAPAATPCTRVLRAARSSGRCCWPSIGATAPFVGLLGTVWGIYHALAGSIADGGQRQHRQDCRARGRGADHDGRRPGRGDPGGAGLQRARPAGSAAARPSWRASRTTCAELRAQPPPRPRCEHAMAFGRLRAPTVRQHR
jgi:hypothetical protein